MSKVSECNEYLYNGNQRTGCHLRGDSHTRIFFQVNGTLNGSSVRNTFEVNPQDHGKTKTTLFSLFRLNLRLKSK